VVYARGGNRPRRTSTHPRRSAAGSCSATTRSCNWRAGPSHRGHYDKPMDMEWAKDGETGELFIVQARPETVQSQKEATSLKTYRLKEKGEAWSAASRSARRSPWQGARPRTGPTRSIVRGRRVLVTEMTDPDWVPIMKRAAAIVTDHGGRTSHAAIVSRELGVPAVVGTGDGHRSAQGRPGVTSPAPKAGGPRLRGHAGLRGTGGQSGRAARAAGAHHDEHRQPRRRAALVAAAGPRGRAGAHGVHHQRRDQDPPAGPDPLRSAQEIAARREIERLTRGTTTRRSTSSTIWPAASPPSPRPSIRTR
jgi:hypothetical protein